MSAPNNEEPRWLDDPRHVNWIIYALAAACFTVTVADFGYHKHAHYGFEEYPGFHSVYGFLSCVGLVLAATQLRKLVMRDEDYYD